MVVVLGTGEFIRMMTECVIIYFPKTPSCPTRQMSLAQLQAMDTSGTGGSTGGAGGASLSALAALAAPSLGAGDLWGAKQAASQTQGQGEGGGSGEQVGGASEDLSVDPYSRVIRLANAPSQPAQLPASQGGSTGLGEVVEVNTVSEADFLKAIEKPGIKFMI